MLNYLFSWFVAAPVTIGAFQFDSILAAVAPARTVTASEAWRALLLLATPIDPALDLGIQFGPLFIGDHVRCLSRWDHS